MRRTKLDSFTIFSLDNWISDNPGNGIIYWLICKLTKSFKKSMSNILKEIHDSDLTIGGKVRCNK